MLFSHSPQLRDDFPALVAGVCVVNGITRDIDTTANVVEFTARAARRLEAGALSAFPEIQAWRRAFARMGLKPTQHRCASEALLRRLSREGSLPRIHPLVDLCNAVSAAYAVPIAALDLARVDGDLQVRYAAGGETYQTFSGDEEHPQPGEVSYVDAAGRAHARRWTNRQSGHSAVSAESASVLMVAEGLHATAATDVAALVAELAHEIGALWRVQPFTALLTETSPSVEATITQAAHRFSIHP